MPRFYDLTTHPSITMQRRGWRMSDGSFGNDTAIRDSRCHWGREEVESSVEAEDVALVGEEAEALVGEEETSNNKIKPNILLLLCRRWSRFPLGFELDTNKTNTNNLCQETRNNNVGDDSIFLIRATHLFPIWLLNSYKLHLCLQQSIKGHCNEYPSYSPQTGDGFDQAQTTNAKAQIHHTTNDDNPYQRNYTTLYPPPLTFNNKAIS